MNLKITSQLVSVASLLYVVAGIILLFFSSEAGSMLGMPEGADIPISMWGTGLLGFGIMNWTARKSILGGIYGRAVVVGSQMHATVGFILLLKTYKATDSFENWLLTALLIVYGLTAALFTYLMLNHPKKPRSQTNPPGESATIN